MTDNTPAKDPVTRYAEAFGLSRHLAKAALFEHIYGTQADKIDLDKLVDDLIAKIVPREPAPETLPVPLDKSEGSESSSDYQMASPLSLTDPRTVTLSPSRNGPLTRDCQMPQVSYTETPRCGRPAVADARIPIYNQWGYLCKQHLESHGPTSKAYVTNITSEPLTFVLRSF